MHYLYKKKIMKPKKPQASVISPYSKFPSGSYKASIRIPFDEKLRAEVMGRFYMILEEYKK
jgi:hypothetical protein